MNTPRTYAKSPELEAAVIADPERDLPRLVYADWLDEHDDPHRAAFIRAQCALWDKNPGDADYPDWVESLSETVWTLRHREDLAQNVAEEINFSPNVPSSMESFNVFHRGFPYFARGPLAPTPEKLRRFVELLPEVFQTTTLRGLILGSGASTVMAQPAMAEVTGLKVSGYDYERSADSNNWSRLLSNSPCVPKLQWLQVSSVSTGAQFEAMRRTEFERLFHFDPGIVYGPASAVEKLFAAPWMKHVRQLGGRPEELSRACGKGFVAGVAGLPSLHTLRTLPSDAVVGALARSKTSHFPALASLDLSCGANSNRAIAQLAKSRFTRLCSFALGREYKTADLIQLIGADWFAGLNRLSLDCRGLGVKTLMALKASPCANRLRHLFLRTGSLTVKSFDALAVGFEALTMLSLGAGHSEDIKVNAAALSQFLSQYANPNLHHLDLDGWPLNDKSLLALAQNPIFGQLRVLLLGGSGYSWKGIQAVLSSPYLQELRVIRLSISTENAKDKKTLAKIADVLKDPGVMPHLVGWR